MPRYALQIAYDGTDFHGWQRQAVGRTVQGELEGVLRKLNRGESVSVIAAGRTDAGVHGRRQVAHVDLDTGLDRAELRYKIGRMIPEDIAVIAVAEVADDFHARFDAIGRSYRYTILTSPDPFRARYAWTLPRQLDLEKMKQAASLMLGRHDFTALSKVNPDTVNMVCNLGELTLASQGETVTIAVRADRFLYGMVRQITGLLVDIGRDRRRPEEVVPLVLARDRSGASMMAPARGLCFERAWYRVDPFDRVESRYD